MPYPTPENEGERLTALQRYKILDTPSHEVFDRIANVAKLALGTPIALVTFVDANRQWFKSCYGMDVRSTVRDISFCAHAIVDDGVFVVPDALADPRFERNSLVVSPPHIRAYAGAPIITPDGHKLGTVCVLDREPRHDIDDEARELLEHLAEMAMSEMELRASAYHLRSDVAEQEIATRSAQEANVAKTEFLSRMSHELRTPLHTVLGYAQLLRQSDLDEDQRDSVVQIAEAGTHLLALIDDTLDMSRHETGHLRFDLQQVDAVRLVRDVVTAIQPQAAERGIVAEGPPPPDQPLWVRADPLRLKQILLNLFGNAVKFSHPGGTVSWNWHRTEDGFIRIEVVDAGIGIPAELAHRAFKPFERLGRERQGHPGVGLGLALSKQFADAMSARIGIAPREPQGAVAWIDLPFDTEGANPA